MHITALTVLLQPAATRWHLYCRVLPCKSLEGGCPASVQSAFAYVSTVSSRIAIQRLEVPHAALEIGLQMAAGRLPKVIKPQPHAIVDYAVAGSFMLMGALSWRRNKRAAVGSLICGGATAVNSLLTDYPGGMLRVISLQEPWPDRHRYCGPHCCHATFHEFLAGTRGPVFRYSALAQTALPG